MKSFLIMFFRVDFDGLHESDDHQKSVIGQIVGHQLVRAK